jgi:hypothetical protein
MKKIEVPQHYKTGLLDHPTPGDDILLPNLSFPDFQTLSANDCKGLIRAILQFEQRIHVVSTIKLQRGMDDNKAQLKKWYTDNHVSLHISNINHTDGAIDTSYIGHAPFERIRRQLLMRISETNLHTLCGTGCTSAANDNDGGLLIPMRDLLKLLLKYEEKHKIKKNMPTMGLFLEPQHMILCLLHLLLRTSEKLVRLLVTDLLQRIDLVDDIKLERIAKLSELMNSRITVHQLETGKPVLNAVKIEVSKSSTGERKVSYSLSGRMFKNMMLSTKKGKVVNTMYMDMLNCLWVDDKERSPDVLRTGNSYESWVTLWRLYIDIMQRLHHKDKADETKMQDISEKITELRNSFFKMFDRQHETPYLHNLFSGHVMQQMRKHGGNISGAQQQSWEKLMHELKQIFNLTTTKGGLGNSAPSSIFPACMRKILRFMNDDIVATGDRDDETYVGKLIREYRKISTIQIHKQVVVEQVEEVDMEKDEQGDELQEIEVEGDESEEEEVVVDSDDEFMDDIVMEGFLDDDNEFA